MNPHLKRLGAALLLVTLLTTASLWLVSRSAPDSASSRLHTGKSLRVGFAVEAPYAFLNERGQVTGESPEILRHVAGQMGVQRLDWVPMDFASLLPELRLGRIDVVAAGMFVTDARRQIVGFTRPTAAVRPALVVRRHEGRLPERPVLADLAQSPDLRWVTVHGAVENGMLTGAGVAPGLITGVPQIGRALRAVAENKADALAISAVTARHLVAGHPDLPLEVRVITDAPAGLPAYAVRSEDTALRAAIDGALKTFIGSMEHIELVQRYGFTQDELPHTQP